MDAPWEKAEVSCPNCREILVLRPGLEEIWCQRCEQGYDVTESANPKDPERTVLVLSKKRQAPGRA
jgi:LSD1 subclass zinc finger protein